MQVLVRMRSQGKYDWRNEVRELARLPMTGEYLTFGPDSPWYLVQMVVHMPYPHDSEAEVYAVQVSADTVKHQMLHGKPVVSPGPLVIAVYPLSRRGPISGVSYRCVAR